MFFKVCQCDYNLEKSNSVYTCICERFMHRRRKYTKTYILNIYSAVNKRLIKMVLVYGFVKDFF